MKWEYKTYMLKEELNLMERKFDEHEIDKVLNSFGNEGFELVGVAPSQRDTGETSKLFFFFKRPIQ